MRSQTILHAGTGSFLFLVNVLLFIASWYFLKNKKYWLGILLLLGSLPFVDSGVGYADRDTASIQPIIAKPGRETNRLFLLFHGYNGSGKSLVAILKPHLEPYGTVTAFESSRDGYNTTQVIRAAKQVIDTHRPDELILYGESFGGMVVTDLLRAYPNLRADRIVFNATPSQASNIKRGGNLLTLFNLPVLHGGPLSTWALQWIQRRDLQDTPSPEIGANERARQQAYEAMGRITAPTVFDEIRYMAGFRSPQSGEFTDRVAAVRYMHAPGSSDVLIKTSASSVVFKKAFPNSDFQDITVASWDPGIHTPTPERPQAIAEQLIGKR